jgi:hypothetical protein
LRDPSLWFRAWASVGRFARILLLATGVYWGLLGGAGASQGVDWVQEGAESLSRTARIPWYDRSQDEVRPVHPRTPEDLAGNRHSAWEKSFEFPTRSWDFSSWRRALGDVFQVLMWVLLVGLAVLLGFGLGWALLRQEASQARTTSPQGFRVHDVAHQIDQLPLVLDPTQLDLLAEARRCHDAGDYSRAAIYLFSYHLVYLDQQHLIRLERGTTNRQYLRQLRDHPLLRSLFEPTMTLFEEVFFGGRQVTREQMDAAWQRLDTFHQQSGPQTV